MQTLLKLKRGCGWSTALPGVDRSRCLFFLAGIKGVGVLAAPVSGDGLEDGQGLRDPPLPSIGMLR